MTMGTMSASEAVSAEVLPSRPESPPAETWFEISPGAKAADQEPGDRCAERDQEGRARRPLLESEDEPADRRKVVVGGGGKPALRRRPCWAARRIELPRRCRRRAALGA